VCQEDFALGVLHQHVEEESDHVDGQAIAENLQVVERDLQKSKEHEEQLPKVRLVIVGFLDSLTTHQKLSSEQEDLLKVSKPSQPLWLPQKKHDKLTTGLLKSRETGATEKKGAQIFTYKLSR
jgi:hypothetical protein